MRPESDMLVQRAAQRAFRQNSLPSLEFGAIEAIPAATQGHHRRGLSLDQRQSTTSAIQQAMANHQHGKTFDIFPRGGNGTVSNANIGHQQPHQSKQEAQHKVAQPGMQRPGNKQQQQNIQPSQQQIRNLENQIKSVYGLNSTVYVTVLPTPATTPRKQPMFASDVDLATLDIRGLAMANLGSSVGIDSGAFDFQLENPESDFGYESTYYSSDAISPTQSLTSSPEQKAINTFFDNLQRLNQQPQSPVGSQNVAGSQASDDFGGPVSPRTKSADDMDLDACMEETGVSAEEVQAYISAQDASTHKWTCLYPNCGKTFGRKENVRSHVQTHLGDRQYRCKSCNKCFVRQHDLKRHAKIHTGDKPHVCPCGAGFARQDALTRHRQRGVCVGGFPNVVRRQARRGRPRKNRPELEERADKAERTRKAVAADQSRATYASFSSDASSNSDGTLASVESLKQVSGSQYGDLSALGIQMNDPTDPFSFEDTSAGLINTSQVVSAPVILARSDNVGGNVTSVRKNGFETPKASESLFKMTAEAYGQTPPTSPPNNNVAADKGVFDIASSPLQAKSNARQPEPRSNPFTTPPRSPALSASSMFNYDTTVAMTQAEAAAGVTFADVSMFPDHNMECSTDLMAWFNNL